MDGTHYTGPPPRIHALRPQIQHRQSSTNSISIRRLPALSNTQSATTRLQSPNLVDRLDRIYSNTDNTANRTSQDSDHEGRRRSFSAPAPFGHEHATARFSAGSGNAAPTSRPESGISFASRPLSGTILQDIAEGAEDTRTPRSESQAVFELPGSVPEVPGGWRDSRTEDGRLVGEQQDVPQRYGSASRRLRSATAAGRLSRGRSEMSSRLQRGKSEMSSKRSSREYESSIVDVLDVVDPYVSTLTTLNNVQNSLFVPDLGRFLNRKPTYELYARPQAISDEEKDAQDVLSMLQQDMRPPDSGRASDEDQLVRRESRATITSQLSESRYAVLPHGVTLDNWSQEDKDLLNDHVRHMMHSKREKFKRQMHAFRNYVKKPLGLFVTVYAFLVTTFGLVWVLFLIGWISGGSKHGYDVNVIDNVLVALFALIGDVLAPFRAVDTYHMIYIVHYHFLTWRLRRSRALPSLTDPNDIPDATLDLETTFKRGLEASVLTPTQETRLIHHQQKFSRSHTFYRPHETETHHAFSIKILLLVVVLLDLHSCFQIALGSITWSWSYHTRPQWLTATVLALSLTCNITGGIWINVGDKRSRKKDVLERMFRQELTGEAIQRVKKARERAEMGAARPYSGT